ncbi:Na_Ca_ex domain-containing protein [Cephalotus follicularis]|uniref:Na_Ca_ex domain-containing protein n=1 Tax=Cephalotus follicularis TaxID=3775 RepID=A0A1Q3CQZ5_CEPFO|nr:Na_Ca_ex domain-containing protein [Cephalotus follicularis]
MASPTFTIQSEKKLSIFLNTAFLFLITFYFGTLYFVDQSNDSTIPTNSLVLNEIRSGKDCSGVHNYSDDESKCMFGCRPKGYINYLLIFYCTCGQFPLLGHTILLLWLLVLFYLLSDTAAKYFCASLESLSRILKLSPTIAGITLLSLGNGASDVFASIVSFTRSAGSGDVGLNSILGGAFFVSSTVVGVISILINPKEISVDRPSFIRDALFFLFTLSSLLLIILIGKITIWGAFCFLSIYLCYVCTVSVMHFLDAKKVGKMKLLVVPTHPVSNSFSVHSFDDFSCELGVPLLGYVDDEKPISVAKITHEEQTPVFFNLDSSTCFYFAICSSQRDKNMGSRGSLVAYLTGGVIGMVLGNIALVTTKTASPPKKCLLPWLASGFLMSVAWTYITAEELISLLVSAGYIFGINPSVLGLTVLAWGNSLGDLIVNAAMAMNGGADGTQIAISGCYAGPMFNTLVGLGLSLGLASWSEYPFSYVIPSDPSLYETIGFLMGGLLWALVVLPRRNMKLDRFLGGGLLAIYFCFLFTRVARFLVFPNFK